MSQVEQCFCKAFAGIEGGVGFFEPREVLRSFTAGGIYCLKLV